MKNLGFWTAVAYDKQQTTCSERMLERVDSLLNFNCLGCKSVQVIEPGKVRSIPNKSSCLMTALRVALLITVIVPTLLLIAKAILRNIHTFTLIDEKKPPAMSSKVIITLPATAPSQTPTATARGAGKPSPIPSTSLSPVSFDQTELSTPQESTTTLVSSAKPKEGKNSTSNLEEDDAATQSNQPVQPPASSIEPTKSDPVSPLPLAPSNSEQEEAAAKLQEDTQQDTTLPAPSPVKENFIAQPETSSSGTPTVTTEEDNQPGLATPQKSAQPTDSPAPTELTPYSKSVDEYYKIEAFYKRTGIDKNPARRIEPTIKQLGLDPAVRLKCYNPVMKKSEMISCVEVLVRLNQKINEHLEKIDLNKPIQEQRKILLSNEDKDEMVNVFFKNKFVELRFFQPILEKMVEKELIYDYEKTDEGYFIQA